MQVQPQLALQFNGQCEEAFRHYERCLEATITFMMTWADSPAAAEVSAEWGPKIYHATLKVGNTAILASDQPADRYQQPTGFDIILQIPDPADAERVFNALADGGVVGMPLQETFWARRFGVLHDRFRMRWVVNCEGAPAPSA
jgi:PhnB protein